MPDVKEIIVQIVGSARGRRCAIQPGVTMNDVLKAVDGRYRCIWFVNGGQPLSGDAEIYPHVSDRGKVVVSPIHSSWECGALAVNEDAGPESRSGESEGVGMTR